MFLKGFSKPSKGKEKDIGDQSSSRKIPPSSGGGEDGDDSNNSSEKKLDYRKHWHFKVRRKINILISVNTHEQAENRERAIAEWMIKGQSKREKPITMPKSFSGKVRKDPTFFLENLIIDVEVNS